METKKLIVDGYNVIHNLDKYAPLSKKDFDLAKRQLISDLSDLKGATGWQITVVFDGRQTTSENIGGVEVIYSAKGKTADTIIEQLSFSTDVGETMVATADYHQQKVVFRPGVHRLTPRELGELIKETRSDFKEAVNKKNRSFLEDRIPEKVREQLEKWRRGKT